MKLDDNNPITKRNHNKYLLELRTLNFYCAKLLLDIEVDGDSHDSKKYYDLGRDQILASIGIKTIRYTNDVILKNLKSVIEDIKLQINTRTNEL